MNAKGIGDISWDAVRRRPDLTVVELVKINQPDNEEGLKPGTAQTLRPGDPPTAALKEVPIVYGTAFDGLSGGHFYQGYRNRNPQEPFLILVPGRISTPEEIVEIILTSWTNLYSTASRYNSIIGFEFVPTAASVDNTAIGADVYDLRQLNGVLVWSDSGGSIFKNGVELIDAYSETADFYYWQGLSYPTVNRVYGLHSDCAMACVDASTGDLLWSTVVFDDWGLTPVAGGIPGTWSSFADPVLIGDRIVSVGEYYDDFEDPDGATFGPIDVDTPPKYGSCVVSLRASDGGDLQIVKIPESGKPKRKTVWSEWAYRAPFWVHGTRVLYANDQGQACCVEIADHSIAWVTDPGEDVAPDYRRYYPLGLLGDSLVCGYEDHDMETLTDNRRPITWDEQPFEVSERDDYKAGHSITAGIVALSVADGSTLWETSEPGEQDWQTRYGPITDYHVDGPTYEYDEPSKPIDSDGDPYPSADYQWVSFDNARDFNEEGYQDLWRERGFDPSTSPEWSATLAEEGSTYPILWNTTDIPSSWEPDKTRFIDEANGLVSGTIQPWQIARFENMGATRTDPTDFLVQAWERKAYTFYLKATAGGNVSKFLTEQRPPFGTGNIDQKFLELYDNQEGAYFSDVATGPEATTLSNGTWVQAGDGDTVTISYRYLWRHQEERAVTRTPTPIVQSGCACSNGTLLIVAGQQHDTDTNLDTIQWRAYDGTGEQWRYEITEVGGEQIQLKGAPFFSDGAVHCHITRNGLHRLLTWDLEGTKTSEVICPNLQNPTFDGLESWIAQDGQSRFG